MSDMWIQASGVLSGRWLDKEMKRCEIRIREVNCEGRNIDGRGGGRENWMLVQMGYMEVGEGEERWVICSLLT